MIDEGVQQREEIESLVFSEKTFSPEALYIYRLRINLSGYDL